VNTDDIRSLRSTGAAPELLAELADVRERADFYEAERDRERLAAEHHRSAYVELEAELAVSALVRASCMDAIGQVMALLATPEAAITTSMLLAILREPVDKAAALMAPDGPHTPLPVPAPEPVSLTPEQAAVLAAHHAGELTLGG
jgi:hypothetical protein